MSLALIEAGQTAWVGASAIAIIGFTNILGTLAWGAMGGRWRMKYLLSLIYLLRSAVMTVFFLLPITPEGTYVFAAAIGFLWLATVPLTSGLVARINELDAEITKNQRPEWRRGGGKTEKR